MRQLLAQNVLNYPESLEIAGILRSACCFCHILDSRMIAKSRKLYKSGSFSLVFSLFLRIIIVTEGL